MFHLLIADAIEMGLVKFQIRSISITYSSEFYVHLRKPMKTEDRVEEERMNPIIEVQMIETSHLSSPSLF